VHDLGVPLRDVGYHQVRRRWSVNMEPRRENLAPSAVTGTKDWAEVGGEVAIHLPCDPGRCIITA
jgi:hypothetical protein